MTQLEIIKNRLGSEEIKQKFISCGIIHLSLFGSYARNEANQDSDLDLVIELDGKHRTTFYELDFLENILTKEFEIKKVDFVVNKSIRPFLKPYIEKDLVNIF